jgi:hypothetical protein
MKITIHGINQLKTRWPGKCSNKKAVQKIYALKKDGVPVVPKSQSMIERYPDSTYLQAGRFILVMVGEFVITIFNYNKKHRSAWKRETA